MLVKEYCSDGIASESRERRQKSEVSFFHVLRWRNLLISKYLIEKIPQRNAQQLGFELNPTVVKLPIKIDHCIRDERVLAAMI